MSTSLAPWSGAVVLGVALLAPGTSATATVAPQEVFEGALALLEGLDTPWTGETQPRPVADLVADLAARAGLGLDLRVSEARASGLATLPQSALTVGAALQELQRSQHLWYFAESSRRVVVLEAYRGDSTDSMPRPIRQVDAEYPEGQRESGGAGEVWLEGLVMADGHVDWLRILREPSRELGEAALVSVRQWEFEPARQGGVPVNVVSVFTVTFRPKSEPH